MSRFRQTQPRTTIRYDAEFDQLWIETGRYSQGHGEIDFEGNRVVLTGTQINELESVLRRRRWPRRILGARGAR